LRPGALLVRADRLPLWCAARPHRALREGDGWSDDPREARYNRFVRLPRGNSHETLIRDDPLYDLIIVLDHNQRPRVRGRGSAVFVHVARPGLTPTAGCLAFDRRDWQRRQRHTTCPAVLLVGRDPRPLRPSRPARASGARSAPRRR
jgi:L,D-peptidoglycan transpeptidase YkuD (ErfK/YbiS/YcfS/YnhG family)